MGQGHAHYRRGIIPPEPRRRVVYRVEQLLELALQQVDPVARPAVNPPHPRPGGTAPPERRQPGSAEKLRQAEHPRVPVQHIGNHRRSAPPGAKHQYRRESPNLSRRRTHTACCPHNVPSVRDFRANYTLPRKPPLSAPAEIKGCEWVFPFANIVRGCFEEWRFTSRRPGGRAGAARPPPNPRLARRKLNPKREMRCHSRCRIFCSLPPTPG